MKEKKAKRKKKASLRRYESGTQDLRSLRLAAAPKPEENLSGEALAALNRDPSFSVELIQHLIERIKAI